MPEAIDKRVVKYLLELRDSATDRIIDVLPRGGYSFACPSLEVMDLEELRHVGARVDVISYCP
jgi:hypothetical protein